MSANTYLTERERRILESARVGIAGAGGLGSNVAMLLVRAGIGKFVIADFDEVNESNLNRQFFFRGQIGEKKVDALARNLRLVEPDLELELHDVRLTSENVAKVFAGCDGVVRNLAREPDLSFWLRGPFFRRTGREVQWKDLLPVPRRGFNPLPSD